MVYSRKVCDSFNYMTLLTLTHLVVTMIPRTALKKSCLVSSPLILLSNDNKYVYDINENNNEMIIKMF